MPGSRFAEIPTLPPSQSAIAHAELFHTAFEFAPIGMALLDLDSKPLRVNHAVAQMLGYRQAEFAGAGARAFVHPEDIDEDFRLRELMLAGAFPSFEREKRYVHKTGRVVWADVSCSLMHDGEGHPLYFLLQVQDITQRKAAEAAQRESEERFRATFEQAALGILHIAIDGRILRVNETLCRIEGYSRQELLAMRANELLLDRSAGRVAEEQALLEGRIDSYRVRHELVRKNGESWPALVSVSLVRAEAAEPYFISILEDLTDYERDQRHIREQALALEQANEALEERIRLRTAELEDSNRQLRSFAYSLAHDMRAPLASTDGFARQLEMLMGEQIDERARHYLHRVRAGVESMSDLIDALLSLANLSHEPLQCTRVDLSALARDWLRRTCESGPRRDVQVEIRDTPAVQGDARLLAVLVANLMDNAWKFTSKCENARIVFSAERSDEGLQFSVRDNGAGFDPAYADKLFMPFQRLHAVNEFAGTGMGLAIVHRIAQRHGGTVWAQAAPGEGATFRFTIGVPA